MLSRRLCAMTGIMTFSSKFPFAPDQVMQASFPITCAQTIMSASHNTGFTFPGMIELPGCVAGNRISPMPQRGPLPSQRMSFAILNKLTAIVFRCPLVSTAPSFAPCASKWFSALRNLIPVRCSRCRITLPGNSRCRFKPVPTAVPPRANSDRTSIARRTRSRA